MYEGLLSLFQANNAKIQSVGGFTDSVATFVGIVTQLKAKAMEVDSVAVGKTHTKNNAEDAMVEALLPVISALYLYGRKQNNAELQALTNITESRVRTKRDTEMAQYGNTICELADTYANGIAPFGIVAERITELKNKVGAYNKAIGDRESSIVDRKGARTTLTELFAKADSIINEEFDRFIELLRQSEVELYNKYFTARVIKDTGIRHRNNGDTVGETSSPVS
jgi:hypothetical protein